MDRSMVRNIALASFAAGLVAGTAGCDGLNKPKFADVVSVKEAKETIRTPREVCEDVVVQKKAPVKDEHRLTGKIVGGVAGGVIGHQIGGGTGQTVATIAGAAGGAYVGNKVQKNMQDKDVVTTTERRCKTVEDVSEKLLGYDVAYKLDGKDGTVRLAFDPGRQIPVKDGQLVPTPPAAGGK
ncbi:MAG: glycine zipper 2TM domain-containing protein [Betaproteobacteria bacterium]|nr:glycine zipper 2TM domain-containing protein [Betaproteobacteria bacterium]